MIASKICIPPLGFMQNSSSRIFTLFSKHQSMTNQLYQITSSITDCIVFSTRNPVERLETNKYPAPFAKVLADILYPF